jgi:hypothetical protein
MVVPEEWLLQLGETELRGFWIDLGSGMAKDAHWQRIEWLTSEHFKELARADDGLDILYRDPADGRLWEKGHDHPDLRDGGPPRLSLIGKEAAAQRYRITL